VLDCLPNSRRSRPDFSSSEVVLATIASPWLQTEDRAVGLWLRLRSAVRTLLPEGRSLPEDVWRARHRGIVILLWLHVAGLVIYGLIAVGQPLHVLAEVAVILLAAVLAGWPRLGRQIQTLVASGGLITCSGLLVHYSGGLIEMHFHFFVMVAVVTLYQSWTPYLLAIAFVAMHHGVVGVLDPLSVYNHRDAWLHPWKWAGIHAAFVLCASFAGITTWRLNEALRGRVEALNSELEHRVIERTAQLEAANKELDRTNKELEAFSYTVSHDLRAPLRAINSFSQILLDEHAGALDTPGQNYLRRVRRATDRMDELIDDLLDLSHVNRSALQREPVDLSLLALIVSAELHTSQPEREVQFVIPEGIMAHGDKRLLQVLLQNLMGNAWKFTSKHASARIELGQTDVDGKRAYFVRDDGAGFDPAYKNMLFRPFQRLHTEAEFEGTGIGLATVERIVARHGGEIWAEGSLEYGATFFFTLPEPAPEPAAADVPPS